MSRRCWLRRWAGALPLVLLAPTVLAHNFWPSYLEIRETAAGEAIVDWRVANTPRGVLPLTLELPDCATEALPAPAHYAPELNFALQRYRLRCADGRLTGRRFAVTGLSETGTSVLAVFHGADGRQLDQALGGDDAGFVILAQRGPGDVFGSYLRLGSGHVLGGPDHLLFVLALVLLLRHRLRRLVLAVTVFTVAHATTLVLAITGIVTVRAAPVEIVIALSVWLLAVELLHPERERRAGSRFFLLLVFVCGLLHGLGFANALTDLGLPDGRTGWALVAFNLGVEAGQIAFALAAVGLLALLGRVQPNPEWQQRVGHAASYGLGTTAVFWTLQRFAVAVS